MLRFIEIALYKLQIITNVESVTIKILNSTTDSSLVWSPYFVKWQICWSNWNQARWLIVHGTWKKDKTMGIKKL